MSRVLPEMVVEDDQLIIGWNPANEQDAIMFIIDGVRDRAKLSEGLRHMASLLDIAAGEPTAAELLATVILDEPPAAPDAHLEAAYEELSDIGGE